jgi:hypothetical protein
LSKRPILNYVEPGTRSWWNERWLPWVAPAIFFALTSAMFGDVLFSADRVVSYPGTDLTAQFLPWRAFGFGEMAKGHLPLWNPYIYGGTPYFAGFQSALLYPPNWLHLILPLGMAINWITALHVFLAGYFTYLWCRHRGLNIGACIIAGAMFMFSGPYFLHLYAGHLPHLALMPWVPLLFLSIDGCFDSPRDYRWPLLGAFVLAMIVLAGHPQYVYYTGFAAAVYLILNLIWPPRAATTIRVELDDDDERTMPTRAWGIAGCAAIVIGGILLSAVQLFTGIQAAGESVRSGGLSYEFAKVFSFPLENFITLFAPHALGTLQTSPGEPIPYSYWGRWYLWEMSLFVSVTGAVLAGYGVFAARGRRKWHTLVIVIVTAILALGSATPLHHFLYLHLPKFGEFRGSSKFTFLTALFLCMLAAYGFDAFVHAARNSRRALALVVTTAAVFLGMTIVGVIILLSARSGVAGWWGSALRAYLEHLADGPVFFDPRQFIKLADPQFYRDAARVTATSILTGAGALLVALALLIASRRWPAAAYGLIAVVAVEMFLFARPTRAVTAANPALPPAWQTALKSIQPDQRVLVLDPGWTDYGMRDHFQAIWGYDPAVLRRYAEVMAVSQHADPDTVDQNLQFRQSSPGIFSMERLALILMDDPRQPAIAAPNPMPVAALVPNIMIRDRRKTLDMLVDSSFDPRYSVILEREPAIKPAGSLEMGSVGVSNETTDSLEIDATIKNPSILLITNNYSTGWRITPLLPGPPGQNGYELMPANWTQQAIPLAPGKHRLRLTYSPSAFRLGAILSSLSLLGYVAAWILLLRRGRGRGRRRRFTSSRTP